MLLSKRILLFKFYIDIIGKNIYKYIYKFFLTTCKVGIVIRHLIFYIRHFVTTLTKNRYVNRFSYIEILIKKITFIK